MQLALASAGCARAHSVRFSCSPAARIERTHSKLDLICKCSCAGALIFCVFVLPAGWLVGLAQRAGRDIASPRSLPKTGPKVTKTLTFFMEMFSSWLRVAVSGLQGA